MGMTDDEVHMQQYWEAQTGDFPSNVFCYEMCHRISPVQDSHSLGILWLESAKAAECYRKSFCFFVLKLWKEAQEDELS